MSPPPPARRRLPRPSGLRPPSLWTQGLRSPREELAESTAHGQVYLRGLQRAQLTLSLLALVAFGAIFGILPLVIYLVPWLQRTDLLGIPLAVWIVALPMFPVFVAIGWLYARRADALDESFRDLVER